MKTQYQLFNIAIIIVTLFFIAGCNQGGNSSSLKVKVAGLEHCGSIQPTIDLVKNTAKELDLTIDFQFVAIATEEQAREHRHLGSPTIQINGLDIEPSARSVDQFGIA